MSRFLKLAKLSVTARLLIILILVAVGIALVFLFTLRGLQLTEQDVRRLTKVEMEQLLISTRLTQQSEMVVSYVSLVGQSNSQSERRLNMVELTDRMLWLDKLVSELDMSGARLNELGGQLLATRKALRIQLEQLGKAVFEPSAHDEGGAQIAALVSGSQMLATRLSLQASHVSAQLRRELSEHGSRLSQNVVSQQERLNWLVAALFLTVIFAGLYVDSSVSSRILDLQREVRKDGFGGAQGQPTGMHGDEIERECQDFCV